MILDLSSISRLRDRGLLEPGPGGLECARISIQQRAELDLSSRSAARRQLETWSASLAAILSRFGGLILPSSLSVSAQTIEALVPVKVLPELGQALNDLGVRVDLVEPRDVT